MVSSRWPNSYEKTLHRLELLSRQEVRLGPSLFRGFECSCTACCLDFTLDFLPDELPLEALPYARPREVRGKTIWTVFPDENFVRCTFLTSDGKCSLWSSSPPLECLAAPQVQIVPRRGVTLVTGHIFSRYWKWPVGSRPQCRFFTTELVADSTREYLRRTFQRYLRWAEYFGISTVIPEILDVIESVKVPPKVSIVLRR